MTADDKKGYSALDTILDFQSGVDRIALDQGAFVGMAAHDAHDRIVYNQRTVQLFY